ncbi:uncharacterized protein LOC133716167 [Rosa rugosa]|uniref:uncharacterized protein LOC133716167 n=1 Tax=Rosa rugosa TaxID=74645 RepID=UPI002B406A12|nr:uncharacterized protein LOC133716167 [Rosa rugosa]
MVLSHQNISQSGQNQWGIYPNFNPSAEEIARMMADESRRTVHELRLSVDGLGRDLAASINNNTSTQMGNLNNTMLLIYEQLLANGNNGAHEIVGHQHSMQAQIQPNQVNMANQMNMQQQPRMPNMQQQPRMPYPPYGMPPEMGFGQGFIPQPNQVNNNVAQNHQQNNHQGGGQDRPVRLNEFQNLVEDLMGVLPRRVERPSYAKPYPAYIDTIPYPAGYRIPSFTLFSEDAYQSTVEHIGRFTAQYGEASSDNNNLRLFVHSLTGPAFTWFINLPPNSVNNWREMERAFHD